MAQEIPEAGVALLHPGSSFRIWSFGLNGGVTTPIIFIAKNNLTNSESELGEARFVKKLDITVNWNSRRLFPWKIDS
jgi:hypothetical protein